MRKLDDYLKFAAECREMARVMLPTFRPQLLQMADTWDQLAQARRDELNRQGKRDGHDE